MIRDVKDSCVTILLLLYTLLQSSHSFPNELRIGEDITRCKVLLKFSSDNHSVKTQIISSIKVERYPVYPWPW